MSLTDRAMSWMRDVVPAWQEGITRTAANIAWKGCLPLLPQTRLPMSKNLDKDTLGNAAVSTLWIIMSWKAEQCRGPDRWAGKEKLLPMLTTAPVSY